MRDFDKHRAPGVPMPEHHIPKPPAPGYVIPPIPPCKPYVPGFSPEEQMAILTHKVNEMIDLFNGFQDDTWGAYQAIVESALTNDAYYNEITVEEGYIPEAEAKYKVVHIPFLDRAKQPIYIELGLAYNNTTNANVHEDVFSASKRTLADKLIPAYNSTNTWWGATVWKNAPIGKIGENPADYTVGITANGFIKVYEMLTNYTQLKQDGVRNAFVANSILVQGGAMTPSKFYPDEKDKLLGRVGMGMNYDTKERFFVIVNGSDASGCTAEMLANIFLKYNCTVAVELSNGLATVGVDKGSMMFVPPTVDGDDVPTIPEVNAFWYITKRRHYRNEYVKDVAELTQKTGECLWESMLAEIAVDEAKLEIKELSDQLDKETIDRENADNELQEADKTLQENIDAEATAREESDTQLDNRITREVQTLNTRIDSEVATLNETIQSVKTELQNNVDTLEEKVEGYHTELNNADIDKVELIQDGTKDTYRLMKKDGTAISVPIEMYNYELLIQKLTSLSNLETALETESQTRANADDELQAQINTLKDDQTKYVPLAGGTMTGGLILSGDPTAEGSGYQAATKAYVDSKVSGAGDGDFKKDGSVAMTGNINVGGFKVTNMADPTDAGDATNKGYVDTSLASQKSTIENEYKQYVQENAVAPNEPIDGKLDLGGNTIENVGTPVNGTDAANKDYVDDSIEAARQVIVLKGTNTVAELGTAYTSGKYVIVATENGVFYNITDYAVNDAEVKISYVVSFNTATAEKGYLKFDTVITTAATLLSTIFPADISTADANFVVSDGLIDFNDKRVLGVDTPLNENEVANKKYVDTGLSSKLSLSGGTMRGALRLAGTPTNDNDAVTKGYVDAGTGAVKPYNISLDTTAADIYTALNGGQSVFTLVGGDETVDSSAIVSATLVDTTYDVKVISGNVLYTYTGTDGSTAFSAFSQATLGEAPPDITMIITNDTTGAELYAAINEQNKKIFYKDVSGLYNIYYPVLCTEIAVSLINTIAGRSDPSKTTLQVIAVGAEDTVGTAPTNYFYTTSEIDTKLQALQDAIDALESTVATKADQSALDSTNATVATKANQSALDQTNNTVSSLQTTVGQKANSSDLNSTNSRVSTLETWKNTYNGVIQTLYNG